jgi:hypothetical protein
LPNSSDRALGRKVPTDWKHVEKYPFSALEPKTPTVVNRVLRLPPFHTTWDQNGYGACEGFGNSMMMTITNFYQTKHWIKYDPMWLWRQAKAIDEWPETTPEDNEGTSGRAACEVLRTQGHCVVRYGKTSPPSLAQGIEAYRWATTVDEIRAAIRDYKAVALGINWWSEFDYPVKDQDGSYWIGRRNWSRIRGGHDICIYGMQDRIQAAFIKNSWKGYPPVRIHYDALQMLLDQEGEAALITDR